MENAPIPAAGHVASLLTAADLKAQMELIQRVMREVMTPGIDYGYIPGTEPKNDEEKKFKKPALFKSGAEKLNVLFRLGPDYEIVEKERDGEHLSITSKCILTHIPSGLRWGSALGSCSTMESKYAYRNGGRVCPSCGAAAIIKGKAEYGGGWLCFQRKEGCGAKFADGDESIEGQKAGKVANVDKADQYNTVLKMSNKRALIATTLNATGASAIFSQDIVDEPGDDGGGDAADPATPRQPAGKRSVQQPRSKRGAPTGDAGSGGAAIDPNQKVSDGQLKMVQRKLDESGVSAEQLCQKFEIAAVPDLTFGKLNEALAWIAQQPAQ
jgi:hypothetical protein